MKRSLSRAAAFMVTLALLTCSAFAAEQFPSRPINIILAFPAGSISATMLRIFGEDVSKRIHQSVVIVPMPGGNGALAADAVLKAPRDGYTIALLSSGNAIATAMSVLDGSKLNYSVEDFLPLTGFAEFTNVVATAPDSRFKTMKEVLEYARANPGKLNVGVTTVNSANDLAARLLKLQANISFVSVHHSTLSSLITEARQGALDVIIQPYGALKGQFDAGALRALAVTVAEPVDYLPGVPTVAASGVPGFDVASWNALYAPKGVPQNIVDLLSREAKVSLTDGAIRARLRTLGVRPIPGSGKELDELMNTEIAKWRDVLTKEK